MISVSDVYHELAAGTIRPLDYRVNVSFTKARNEDISWFTLDRSVLDGGDLLGDDDTKPVQIWDAYEYQDISERLVDMSISRSVEFPYNVQSAIADFTLNNYDGYLSIAGAGGESPLSPFILPKRPCRLYLGFTAGGQAPQFVGLTQGIPSYDGFRNERVSFTALDFLSEIGNMKLKAMVMMRDVRTDEVIAAILDQFGLEPQMYELDHGLNVIPFAYFEPGKDAGQALRELVQAEDGSMWLDEQGIIRFQPRTAVIGKTPVMTFDSTNLVTISAGREAQMVNSIFISAEVRKVLPLQPVFADDNANGYSSEAAQDNYRVPANGTKEIWLNFDDPVWTANPLVLNGSAKNSNFTAVDLNGNRVSTGVGATGTLFATSYKLELVNNNSFPVSINYLELWGEPARMVGGQALEYEAEDEESVAKYGQMRVEITDNRCFGSLGNARGYALDVLRKYSEYNNTLTASVKGDPSLQLSDIVEVDYPMYDGLYVVTGISHKLTDARLETELSLRKTRAYTPFILDQSVLNGEDVLS
jgi:hypothetical protein